MGFDDGLEKTDGLRIGEEFDSDPVFTDVGHLGSEFPFIAFEGQAHSNGIAYDKELVDF